MKKFVTLFLAFALVLSLAITASANLDGAIKKGTAVVDGQLDDVYTDSFSLKGLGTGPVAPASQEWWNTASADIYFLYDDSYLYICALVSDDDVLSKGEAFATGENPYENDNIELRLSLDGSNDTIKVAVDAYGYACYGLAEHYEKIDYSTIKYAATHTNTSYSVEVAIPCTKGNLDMIKTGKLGFKYQLNDINADGKHVCHATSFFGEKAKAPVFIALSDEVAKAPAAPQAPTTEAPVTEAPVTEAPVTEAPVTEAPVTEAPVTEAPVTEAPVTEAPVTEAPVTEVPATPAAPAAPATFDPAIIAVALTAASGAAFVIASKKH